MDDSVGSRNNHDEVNTYKVYYREYHLNRISREHRRRMEDNKVRYVFTSSWLLREPTD
jgi:hypothetical protein